MPAGPVYPRDEELLSINVSRPHFPLRHQRQQLVEAFDGLIHSDTLFPRRQEASGSRRWTTAVYRDHCPSYREPYLRLPRVALTDKSGPHPLVNPKSTHAFVVVLTVRYFEVRGGGAQGTKTPGGGAQLHDINDNKLCSLFGHPYVSSALGAWLPLVGITRSRILVSSPSHLSLTRSTIYE